MHPICISPQRIRELKAGPWRGLLGFEGRKTSKMKKYIYKESPKAKSWATEWALVLSQKETGRGGGGWGGTQHRVHLREQHEKIITEELELNFVVSQSTE